MSTLKYGTLRANPKAAYPSSIMLSDAYCECSKKPYCEDVSAPITEPIIGFEYSETIYHSGEAVESPILFPTPIDPASPTFIEELEAAFACEVRTIEFCVKVYGTAADGVRHIGQSEVKWITASGTVANTRNCNTLSVCELVLTASGTTPDWVIDSVITPLAFDFAYTAGDDAANQAVAAAGLAAVEALFATTDNTKVAVLVNDVNGGFDIYVQTPFDTTITVGGKSLVKCGDATLYVA